MAEIPDMQISMDRQVENLKRNDWILAGGAAGIAALLFVFYLVFQKGGSYVQITVDGRIYGTYALDEDRTIEINGTNTLVIRDNKADMVKAQCPDKLCVHQRAISKSGESIICLPEKIAVSIQGSKEESGVDSIAG